VNPPRIKPSRHLAAVLAVAVLAIAVALPVLAASPSPGVAPAASPRSPEAEETKEPKEPKGSHAPEVQVTVRGLVKSTTDAKGRPDFTIDANGKTLKLEAGPKWFFGTKHPLLPFVGKTVTIVGEQSGDEIDVVSVDGTALRAPGRPPWAGGWKINGKIHPGWSQEKADRQAAKQKAKAAAKAAADSACVASGKTLAECKAAREAAKAAAKAAAQATCVASGKTPAECQARGKGHDDEDADESPEPAETPGIG
jgi:hypothetical protein